MTVARDAILQVLHNADSHLSADEIYRTIAGMYPHAGLTTVYRTLDLLVHMGLVFRFDFGDGRARYELAEGPGRVRHHHHLICTKCGRVVDYTDFVDEEQELIAKTEKGLSQRFGFSITNHLIQFYGVCASCRSSV